MEKYYSSKVDKVNQQIANNNAKGECSNNPLKDITQKLAESIISNQLSMNFNHEIRFTPWYKKEIKHFGNKLQEKLIEAEKHEYDKFFDAEENASIVLYESMDKLVKTIARIGLQNYGVLNDLLIKFENDQEMFKEILNE